MSGLSVSDVVNVSVQISPPPAALQNFGSLLILGDSDIIDVTQRFRAYTNLTAVGADFGSTAPEYLGAQNFFSQSPTPALLYIGRWASTGTHGTLRGDPLTAAEQNMSNFTAITNGGVNFVIDGNAKNLTGLNFTGQTNLNGVAAVIQAAFAGSATVTWDSVYLTFVVKSSSTGNASSASFATTGGGTDVSGLLGLQSGQGGYVVPGINAETIESCVNTFLALTNVWYGLSFASTQPIADADVVQVANIIEATTPAHFMGTTTQEAAALLSTSSTDLPALLQAGNYKRTFCQYSSTDAYAAIGIFGRFMTINFNGSNTMITLKFKQEPGTVPETLTESQAQVLTSKNCNVFVNYNNSTAILQQGVTSGGYFIDEIVGIDWLSNQLQTDLYNALFTSPTKIPQTDAGVAVLANVVTADLELAVANGFVAPGVWTGPPIGALVTGQTLTTGYYVFQPPIASQPATARAARQAPTIQAAIKLAGAFHFANVILSVNP